MSENLLPIDLQNVSFSYPSRIDNPIVDNLNLTFSEKTKITAIVGSSGSGKSTIAQLLLGLYSPQTGSINFNTDTSTNFDNVRSQIGYVAQEPVLFSTSIRENIVYGLENPEEITETDLIEISKKAQAFEFIQKLPQGFDTNVGEQGSQLSGGQKQRIAIARALVRKPKLLILDEATSALDSESELGIQKAIYNASEECCVVMIAHRLSTVKSANRILVLNEGQLIEDGSFDHLVSLENGVFRNLVETQAIIGHKQETKQ